MEFSRCLRLEVGGLRLEAEPAAVGGWRPEVGGRKKFLPQTSSEAILKPNADKGDGGYRILSEHDFPFRY